MSRVSAAPGPKHGTAIDGHLGLYFLYYDNCLVNIATAIAHRVAGYYSNGVYYGQLPVLYPISLLRPVRNMILAQCHLNPPLTEREFCDCFTGFRKERYLAAVASMEEYGFDQVRDSGVSPFCKREKYGITEAKPNPSPRAICPRDPKYTVMLGRYLKPNEHAYYHAIDKVCMDLSGSRTPSIVKGCNALEIGEMFREKWSLLSRPVAVMLDVSRFEFHVGKKMLQHEHSYYTIPFPEIRELVKAQLRNRIKAMVYSRTGREGTVTCTLVGRRMSGDINTGLGNIILMMNMVITFCLRYGIKPLIVDNGDDLTLLCEESQANMVATALPAFFAGFGFRLKVEGIMHELEHIKFCRMQPVYRADIDKYVMVREPYEALSKDHIMLKNEPLEPWLKAVAAGGCSMTTGIPVHYEYYQSLRRGLEGVREADLSYSDGKFYFARRMEDKAVEPHPLTRASYAIAFGIGPKEQAILEAKYRSLDSAHLEECVDIPQARADLLLPLTAIA